MSPDAPLPATGDDPGNSIQPAEPTESVDTSYEIDLDPPPDPTGRRGPVYVDVIVREDDDRRPIVPAALRGGNLAPTVRLAVGRTGHRVGYHAVRSPAYVLLASVWAAVGVFRLTGRQLRWWWHAEQSIDTPDGKRLASSLLQEAANQADFKAWDRVHGQVKATRKWRGLVLLAELGALVVAVALLATLAPRWVALLALALAVPYLAHVGRPRTRPIVSAAVVTPRFRRLTADIVLRAYYAAGLGHPDKPDQQVKFGGPMARDGEGSRVMVDLPYGKGLNDAMGALGKIASGLDVALAQVYISRDRTSHRRHVLWVADRDPLAVPAGRTPLLRLKPTDIWAPAPLGLDERGRPVTVPLMWTSVLVGALPRQGKTFTARTLALYAALDPYVRLSVFDPAGKPDWRRFALVADQCAFGLTMTRDGDPIELLLDALREIKADVQSRYQRLSELPASVCPEGKLTREIARDPRYKMPVRMIVIDECQEAFDLGEASREIASLLVFLVKVAPAAGVIVLDATQKPSGVGSGQVAQQFTAFRDNHQVRFSLRTSSYNVSELVLGAGSYGEGLDSSKLLADYKGVGILRGASDESPTVRTYLADGEDAERILRAARGLRERAGTLSGYAAGETMTREARDVLADVRRVYYAGEAHVSWQQIAARLAEQTPEQYAGVTAEAISAEVRAAGVKSVDGKRDGRVLKGARAEDLDDAMTHRVIGARS